MNSRREIHSFVRRSGRVTAAQQRALAELWPRFGIDYSSRRLDLDEVFGRSAPRVLEIGFGNGETFVAQAAADPGCDYLGVEVHEPGIGHALLLAGRAGLSNLRVIAEDAVAVLSEQIADAALRRINIYFPDPWPKKRHHKRRLLQPEFLELLAPKLERGGALHLATDWAGYAAHIDELVAGQSAFRTGERREHSGEAALDRPATKFEKRGLDRGHRIWDWRLVRI
ncbi:MAG: tRNA (guanosine(46)-N7)-methyltransferase TrmB [Woeseiaceae bacterium]